MSSSFKSSLQLQTKIPSVSSVTLGLAGTTDPSEARYWAQHFDLGGSLADAKKKKYASPKSLNFEGPSTNAIIHQVIFGPPAFGASSPLAVVSGPRVGLYGTSATSSFGRALIKSQPQLTDLAPDRQVTTGGNPALCGQYRADGRLIAVGTDNGQVRVCDATSRATLCTFGTNNGLPIRTIHWLRNGKQLFSGGDDGLLRLWSLSEAMDKKASLTMEGHGDVVRCSLLWEPKRRDSYKKIAISGSYDHTIRVWDLQDGLCLGIMDHGAPVEALLLMSSTGTTNESPWLLSAGGTQVKVWNMLSGECHETLRSQHSKTITSLVCMARTQGSDGDKVWRILTTALDGLIRIHTWDAEKGHLKYVHGIKRPDPITTLAFNETYSRMAFGTTTGKVVVRQEGSSVISRKTKREPRGGTYAYFTRGMNTDARADDFVVMESKKRKLQAFDLALKQFRYGDALDEALDTRQPQSVIAVLEDLGRRRGLTIALSNRDEESLEPILSFTVRYITRPQFASLLIGVSQKLCEIYGDVAGQSEVIDELFSKLKNQVHQEIVVQKSLLRISGMIDALTSVQFSQQDML